MPILFFLRLDNAEVGMGQHVTCCQKIIARHGGSVCESGAGGIAATFHNADGLACALEIQTCFAEMAADKPDVRIALCADDGESTVAWRRARYMAEAGWGGQILLSARAVGRCKLPGAASLQDLGPHQFRDLARPQKVYHLAHPRLPAGDPPPLRSLSAYRHNLPTQSTAFIGRQAELDAIGGCLDDPACRLLTLVGRGGVGKTRLALQAAAARVAAFPDGAYYVPLAPLSSGERIPTTIADAIGCDFYSSESPQQQLLDYLREKRLLLVLDSFEHLLEHVPLVTALLDTCPDVQCVLTSCAPVSLDETRSITVQGMRYPEAAAPLDGAARDYDAIRLFLHNARRSDPDFEGKRENWACIVRICQLLEGLPLGIELAATWVRMLDCAEIVEEIEHNLDFLTTSARELPARHRSLRAVLDYSWKLLEQTERDVLKQLSVFRGGFQAEAALAVAQTDMDALTKLVNQAHLHYDEQLRRYTMPLALHQYAEERLHSAPAVRCQAQERLSLYSADYLKQREADIQYAYQTDALDEIAREIENLRAGWDWALAQGRYALIAAALDPFFHFYKIRGWFREGLELFRVSLAALEHRAPPGLIARFYLPLAWFCFKLGEYEEAETWATRGLVGAREHHHLPDEAFGNYVLGYIHHRHGQNAAAIGCFKAALRIYRPLQDWLGVVNTLNALGNVIHTLGDFYQARHLREESLKICRQINYHWGWAINLNNLGSVAMQQGEYQEALALYRKSRALLQRIGNRRGLGTVATSLATVTHVLGECEKARALYEEGREHYRETGHRWGVAYIDLQLGFVWRDLGDHAAARAHCERGKRVARDVRNQWGVAFAHILEGYLALDAADYAEASGHFRQSIALAEAMQAEPLVLRALVGMAHIHLAAARFPEAAHILGIVLAHPACEHALRETARQLTRQLPAPPGDLPSPEAVAPALAAVVRAILD